MRMPSTRTLKTFQTAARTGSFKQAASRLFLTPSAVSYRIKSLENDLGVTLFHRGSRELTITEAGAAYLSEVDAVFRQLDSATRALKSRFGKPSLRVRVAPYFASEFLLPRLANLNPLQFDMDILVDPDGASAARPEEADVSIVLASEPPPGMQGLRLLGQSYVPACAPTLLATRTSACLDVSLSKYPLLVHNARQDAWERWAETAGIEPLRPSKRISFDTMTELVQAAERGVGIGLVPVPLAVERLRANSLSQVSDRILTSRDSYFMLYRAEVAARAEVTAFRDWMLRELEIAIRAI
jgi:LysR family glycine cleavage system transcriptional activator